MGDSAGTGDDGAAYVWALEILCAHFGQKLPNAAVAERRRRVAHARRRPDLRRLARRRLREDEALVYGTWPVKIPHAESPRGGGIDAGRLSRALEVMRNGALPKFDREIIAVIGDVRGWLEACVARGAGLVAFYY